MPRRGWHLDTEPEHADHEDEDDEDPVDSDEQTVEAERNFRRVRGCKEMPTLLAALRRHNQTVTPANYDQAAA